MGEIEAAGELPATWIEAAGELLATQIEAGLARRAPKGVQIGMGKVEVVVAVVRL